MIMSIDRDENSDKSEEGARMKREVDEDKHTMVFRITLSTAPSAAQAQETRALALERRHAAAHRKPMLIGDTRLGYGPCGV